MGRKLVKLRKMMRKLLNSMECFCHLAPLRRGLGSTTFAPLLLRSCSTIAPFNVASQIPSSLPRRTKEEKLRVEQAFHSAVTSEQLIKAFMDMEEAGAFDERELGLASLKIGLTLDSQGEDPEKVLPFANTALNAFDKDPNKSSLPLAITLQLLGSLIYRLNKLSDSFEYVNRANRVLCGLKDECLNVINDVSAALFSFRHKFLFINYHAMGRQHEALAHMGICGWLGYIKNQRSLATIIYLFLGFEGALGDCYNALKFQKECSVRYQDDVVHPVQVARDRRLLGILCSGLEESKKNDLAQRILKNWNLSSDLLQAEIDAANRMTCLGRYDDAIGILKNAVQHTDKDSGKRALVLISMAKVLYKQDKYAYCERCLEISLGIFDKSEGISPLVVAEAITEISNVYDTDAFIVCRRRLCTSFLSLFKREWISSMEVAEACLEISTHYETTNDLLTGIWILECLLDLLKMHPQLRLPEGIVSARIGRLLLLAGEVEEATLHLKFAAKRLKDSVGPKPFVVGYVYNNLGVAYLELDRPQLALQMFAAAKDMMDASLGPHHADSIEACQNLSKSYGVVGSYDVAVKFQQMVIDAWERLGASAEDELGESRRLLEQLKEKALGAYAGELHLKVLPLPIKAGASLSMGNI